MSRYSEHKPPLLDRTSGLLLIAIGIGLAVGVLTGILGVVTEPDPDPDVPQVSCYDVEGGSVLMVPQGHSYEVVQSTEACPD